MSTVLSGNDVLASPAPMEIGAASPAVDPLLRAYDLPCTLVLEVPVVEFNVGAMMALTPGSIVETATQHNEDLKLTVNGQLVGLVEFDVVGDQLAVRLTGML